MFRWHQLSFIAAADYPDEISYRHSLYHHRYKPKVQVREKKADYDVVYTTNSLGLRGARDYGPKPKGVRRLLMLGDSFTFGIGVNDQEPFSVLLQQALDRQGGGVEVVNAGVGSYSPTLHYLTLRDLYLAWQPDAVILWLDFGDIQDDYLYAKHLRYDRQGRLIACDPDYVHGRFDWVGALLKRSAFIKYLHSKLIRSYQKIGMLGLREYLLAKVRGEDTQLKAVYMAGQRRQRVDIIKYDRYLMIHGSATIPELDRYWQQTGGYILKIRDLLRQQGIPLVLGLYPYGVQVGPNQWADGREYLMFEKGKTYGDLLPFEFIESFARASGIPVINTHPSFLKAREEVLFLRFDGHFTPAGHRVLAEHTLQDPVFGQLLESIAK